MKTTSTTPAAPKAAVVAPAPAAAAPSDLVRVYNRSRRIFTHEIYKNNPHGLPPCRYVAAANAHVTIPRWLAEMWMRMFPDDIISGDAAMRAVDATQADLIASEDKRKALEAEKAALEEELKALRAKISGESAPPA